ncbi:myotubularin-related protein 10-A [Parasteatoda tepidariorum]|uniref:myotubularin-related protein 10-A n=1 Tax=Parasteatoda tepidariorum TaxID=114398 RepID=UPI00077FC6F8|nr:myotubularin-related protein 10-A [Parasteatoda tepidariorum]
MTTNWLKDLNRKPRSNSVKTFKSYVDLDSNNSDDIDSPISSIRREVKEEESQLACNDDPYPTPVLLNGEIVIAQAENVLKFNTLSELNKGLSGLLLCTNFKVSFLTAENYPSNLHQKNALLGEFDLCLINIDAVYHVNNGKRKKLSISNAVSNIEILEIHCKDLRIYTFSFKFSPLSQRSVISTILHHAFPPRINLLFAFDYKDSSKVSDEIDSHSLLFTRVCDWESELERCNCPGWRVTLANEKFLLCESLPESFVVPSILLDMNLNKTAPHFNGHRVPTWSWGLSSGASIVRMAALDPSITDSRQKDVMVDAISRASPRQVPVRIFNLEESGPSYKDVQNSFLKLKELCMPTSPQEFWETDSNYFSKLESTKWLHHISFCLKTALQACTSILKNTTVIFSEHEGRDLNCIVSSLVQLMLDPIYRSRSGFELLIQKEWVALGHAFTERHHLISGSESEEAPVFLLFLDCVWQLTEQCPTVFEFSETYLTSLWDSCHVSVFDTFLFNCHKNRFEALSSHSESNSFQLQSVWKWSRQFSRNDLRLFANPLYILNKYAASPTKTLHKTERPKSFSSLRDAGHSQSRPLTVKKLEIEPLVWEDDEENLLKIDPYIKSLKFWHQCYLRWIPLAHILGGGPPVLFLNNLKINAEIQVVEKKIKNLSNQALQPKVPSRHRRAASDDYTLSAEVIDPGHTQDGTSVITSAFPFAPVAPWDWTSYHFAPSTSCLQISYSEIEELDD